MITEDYVSFEIAKLLKEKGFEGCSIITTYDADAANAYIKELKEKHLPYSSDDPKLKEFYYTMPTLQMAMKWLREVHHIHIRLINFTDETYRYEIYPINDKYRSRYFADNCAYDTYEDACEVAIKFCLEHLI